jgi:hypothetical protein
VEPMITRTTTVGYIQWVNVGVAFIYRTNMYLVGLHVDLINGISLRILDVIEVEIASCVVTVYHLHNTFLDKDLVIYGTEGGRLNHINQLKST